jgi:streptogramin lyase
LLIALCIALFATSCGSRADPSPKVQAPPPFEFLGTWGERGVGPGKFDKPVAFAVDALGKVFFADPDSHFVHKFESNGTPLLSFEDSRLLYAAGIAVDLGGAIYVADADRGNILIFFPDGTFLRAIHTARQPHLSGPLGISVDDQGNLYVPDPERLRVMKFNGRGWLVKSWKVPQNAPGVEERPSYIATSQDGSVFVAYANTGRIEKYSSNGLWITSWKEVEEATGNYRAITGFAVAGDFVFTAGATPPRIHVWTLDGQSKLEDDLGGRLDGVAAPQIAVTPREELLVFDPAALRVLRFRMHL